MKKNLHYLFLLDRSGSMASVVKQTIEGINGQIDTLKAEAKKHKKAVNITASLMLFDSPNEKMSFDFVYLDKPAEELEHIIESAYVPRGGTPLRDAIGQGITKMKELLGANLGKRNHTVLVTILTDGEENSSKEYTHKQVQDTIKELSDSKRWIFTFMGAGGIKEIQNVATSFNIDASNSFAFAADARGITRQNVNYYGKLTSFVDNFVCSGSAPTTKFFNQTEEEITK